MPDPIKLEVTFDMSRYAWVGTCPNYPDLEVVGSEGDTSYEGMDEVRFAIASLVMEHQAQLLRKQ